MELMHHFRVLSLVLILFVVVHEATLVTIDNLSPRLDIHGNIMDAHDGPIQRFTVGNSTLYYIHAMQYGLCAEPAKYGCDRTNMSCGFQQDHNISIWSSPDLSSGSWTYVGNSIAYTDRPAGVVFRPQLIFNPNTKLYVLWWNYDTDAGEALLAAGTASTPAGPFELQNKVVNVSQGQSGDYTIFADDDGTAYVVYSMNFIMRIEQLTPDFLHVSNKTGLNFPEYFVEAPAMFKRNGTYYVIFGYCCCYCEQGSGVMVHTASHPLGPYTKISGDLACVANSTLPPISFADDFEGIPSPGQGCQYANSALTSITRAQQNYVVQVETPTGMEYIWTGDRWQQSPDGIKGHDPQYWVPLQFDSTGKLQNITWQPKFTLNVVVN